MTSRPMQFNRNGREVSTHCGPYGCGAPLDAPDGHCTNVPFHAARFFKTRDEGEAMPTERDLNAALQAELEDAKYELRNKQHYDRVRAALLPLFPDQPKEVRAGWLAEMAAQKISDQIAELRKARDARAAVVATLRTLALAAPETPEYVVGFDFDGLADEVERTWRR